MILDSEYVDDYSLPLDALLLTTSDDKIASGIAVSDPIYFYEADGYSLIDSYSNPFNPGNGYSAEKVNYSAGDVLSNWTTSPCGSTPGWDNCASQ